MHSILPTLFLVLILTLPGSAFSRTTTDHTYHRDGQWWKCTVSSDFLSASCIGGPVDELGLSPQQAAYVKGVLDKLPWAPKKNPVDEVVSQIGVAPSMTIVGRLIFKGNVPGLCPGCELDVDILNNQLILIRLLGIGDRTAVMKARPE